MRARPILEIAVGIALVALSFYLYLLYQGLEFPLIGFSSIALFAPGSLLILWNIKPLKPLKRIATLLIIGATVSLTIVTFRLDVVIANSYYGAMLAYGSSRLSWLVLTVAGVNVQLRDHVLIFSNGRALAIGPFCGGAYSSLVFLVLSLIMVADVGRKAKRSRVLIALVIGILGVNLANMLRITFLASITYLFGISPLEVVHQFGGYAIFLGFMSAFWLLSLRWLQPRRIVQT